MNYMFNKDVINLIGFKLDLKNLAQHRTRNILFSLLNGPIIVF